MNSLGHHHSIRLEMLKTLTLYHEEVDDLICCVETAGYQLNWATTCFITKYEAFCTIYNSLLTSEGQTL